MIGEIQTLFKDKDDADEWLCLIKNKDGSVSINRDYISYTGERRTWYDEGISIEKKDIRAVIDILEKALNEE